MSRRDNAAARCVTCQMQETLCVCDRVPRLSTRTRLSLLLHYREARKPTNTGQLAARCLERSEVGIVGDLERPLALPLAREGEVPLLLFPDVDAAPIERFAGDPRLVLIVPDGTWRQASKMRRRIPGLDAVQCVRLPDTAGTTYRLRSEPRDGGLATLEAIARALRILEGDAGPAVEAELLAVFRVMVHRTLWLRGALADEDVAGGIPEAAVANDPRGAGSTAR